MNIKYWSGTKIDKLEENEVFVFGSNPQGINGAGAAKAAMSLSKGAKHGVGRGFNGSNAYALVTKSLNAGFLEKATGIVYDKAGYCSVSPEQIRANIDELYETAKKPEHLDKRFLISYQYETWPNGTPKKSLNGYTSQEMLEMFIKDKDVPPNIIFHESYKLHIEKLYEKQNNNKKNYHFFFRTHNIYSQWHPSIFHYKNYQFLSCEQFMMFSKAKLFNDNDIADKVINIEKMFSEKEVLSLIENFKNNTITSKDICNNKEYLNIWNKIQNEIKKLGRQVKNFNESIWDSKKQSIIYVGNREKFLQNNDFLNDFLSKKDLYFVEASPYDKIWGIGLSAEDAKRIPEDKWPGANLLGVALNKLKEDFLLGNKRDNKLKV